MTWRYVCEEACIRDEGGITDLDNPLGMIVGGMDGRMHYLQSSFCGVDFNFLSSACTTLIVLEITIGILVTLCSLFFLFIE